MPKPPTVHLMDHAILVAGPCAACGYSWAVRDHSTNCPSGNRRQPDSPASRGFLTMLMRSGALSAALTRYARPWDSITGSKARLRQDFIAWTSSGSLGVEVNHFHAVGVTGTSGRGHDFLVCG